MPEGPEIRRAADKVAKAVVGRPLERVYFGLPHLEVYAEPLGASKVEEVETRGKGMLTHFDCGLTVYSHNQLYGRWYVRKAGNAVKTGRQLRFAMYGDTHWALLYSASDINVVEREQVEEIPFIARVGPDCLHRDLRPSRVTKRLVSDRFKRRQLGHLLLDQAFIAGIGNYLRSEILFVAGLHPSMKGADCTQAEAKAFGKALVEVCRRSYRTGGITNDPKTAAQLKAQGWRRREYRHFVFRRGGEGCHQCGTEIVGTEVSGRHLSYCPCCQKRRA